jgi:hypothetical protein
MTGQVLTRKQKAAKWPAWSAEVTRILDESGRDYQTILTLPMLRDGFDKNEFPAYFAKTVLNLID